MLKELVRHFRRSPLSSQSLERASVEHMAVATMYDSGDYLLKLTGNTNTDAYTGNTYVDGAAQVVELERKYLGKADWGCSLVANLIDVRAAFQLGAGVKVIARGSAVESRETAFINAVLADNQIDGAQQVAWAREAEIEGRFVAVVYTEAPSAAYAAPVPIRIRFLPWTSSRYKIIVDPTDYQKITGLEYRVNGRTATLSADQFIYARFRGRQHLPNDSPPKLGAVLNHIENLDKAMSDWRRCNNYFGNPTPHIQVERTGDISRTIKDLKTMAWRVGRLLVTTGPFKLVETSGQSARAIRTEIESILKIISGATGVPPHILGFADLLSNRDTADSMVSVMIDSMAHERTVWRNFYSALFKRVIHVARENNLLLDEDSVSAQLESISKTALSELSTTWLPLYMAGVISLETLLAKIPELDAEEELKRQSDNNLVDSHEGSVAENTEDSSSSQDNQEAATEKANVD